jgi:hypothetical protein
MVVVMQAAKACSTNSTGFAPWSLPWSTGGLVGGEGEGPGPRLFLPSAEKAVDGRLVPATRDPGVLGAELEGAEFLLAVERVQRQSRRAP